MGQSWGRVVALALGLFTPVASAQPAEPAVAFAPTRRGANRWEGSLAVLSLDGAIASGPYGAPVALSLYAALGPRVWLGRGFQLRGALSLSRSFADDDSTTVRPETRLHDPSVALWFHGIPSFADFHPAVAVGMVFPLSDESQARTLLLGTSVTAQLAWWRRLASVTLFARASVGWGHRFYEYTTPGVRSLPSMHATCFGGGGSSCSDQISGVPSITDYLSAALTFAPRWRYFSPGISFQLDRAVTASFAPVGVSRPAADLYFTTFATWIEVIPTPPLSVILSYSLSRPALDADGSSGNPFWAPYQFPVVGLALAVRLDELFAVALGEPLGPGGVVRW